MNSKKKSKNIFTKYIWHLLAAFIFFAIGYLIFPKTQPLGINEVITYSQDSPLMVEGVVFKDTPVGVPGHFYLLNNAGKPILLDQDKNLDSLIGSYVSIKADQVLQTEEQGMQSIRVIGIDIITP